MFTKLTNMIGKIKYALCEVKLNAQTFTRIPTSVPLITCVIDDTNGEKCSSRSTSWTEAVFDWCLAWFWAKCHQYV